MKDLNNNNYKYFLKFNWIIILFYFISDIKASMRLNTTYINKTEDFILGVKFLSNTCPTILRIFLKGTKPPLLIDFLY